MAEQADAVLLQETLNRYLLYFPQNKSVTSDVHSFTGEETLSQPYRYTIRFTSSDFNLPLGAVLNQMAGVAFRIN